MVDTNRLIYPHEWVGIGLVSGIAYVLAKYALKERSFEAEKKNCGCGKDPCITYGAEPCGNYGAESFEAEPLKITGLEKLTNEQLSNLEEWVNKYIHKSIDEIEAINDEVAYELYQFENPNATQWINEIIPKRAALYQKLINQDKLL